MKKTDIQIKVFRIVSKCLKVPKNKIKLSSKWEDIGADSIDFVEIIIEVEKAFKIVIPDDRALSFNTVKSMINFVDNELKPKKRK